MAFNPDVGLLCNEMDTLNDRIITAISDTHNSLTRTGAAKRDNYLRKKLWFDHECVAAKKLFRVALKVFKRDVDSQRALDHFLDCRKSYEKLIKQKKTQFENINLDKLAKVNNASDFWQTVN